MFARLFFCVFLLAGLYGCFGYKVNSVETPKVTDGQTILALQNLDKIVGVPSQKSKTVLTFPKPVNVIHIEVNGSNRTGDGSLEKPFRTLHKAVKVAKKNTLIKMGVGVFKVKPRVRIPNYVSIEGVGEKTVIVPGKNYKDVLLEARDFQKEKGDGYQYFRNFNLDGLNQSKLGFRAWDREHSLFENINFINFTNAGIELSGLKNEISNCRFINTSGREGKNGRESAGAIRFMSTDGVLIHDNYIEENSGGGIKSVARNIRNTQIYNNKINIVGSKNKRINTSPSVEIWDLLEGNKIYNNDLNAWVSLISQWDKDEEIPETGNLFFYHNKLHGNPGVTDRFAALELGIKGAELYENSFSGFKNRIFWIEGWGGKEKPTKNIKIHDNKLYNCRNAMLLGPNGNGVENLSFYENYIENCNGINMGMKGNNKLINISIIDNIFINAKRAITIRGKIEQYVNLLINNNKAYSSQVGLYNNVKGLKVGDNNPVTLKKGLPTTKDFEK